MVDDGYELKMIDALQPLRFHAVASVLYQLFDSGLYDLLDRGPKSADELAGSQGWDPARLTVFLLFLRNEGYLEKNDGAFRLTAKARTAYEYRGFYIMYVGGYGKTLLALAENLPSGTPGAAREAGKVGQGSTLISTHDVLPLTIEMLASSGGTRLLEIGAGDGRLLIELCKRSPQFHALVVEPSEGGCAAARELVKKEGLEARVRVERASLQEFLKVEHNFTPDIVTLSFVLQEVLGQDGEGAVIEFLRALTERFPRIQLLVTEMANDMEKPAVMRHGMGLAVLNMHYLLHPFTRQRLEPFSFWADLFERSGLQVVSHRLVDPRADSTGTIGSFLLRKKT